MECQRIKSNVVASYVPTESTFTSSLTTNNNVADTVKHYATDDTLCPDAEDAALRV